MFNVLGGGRVTSEYDMRLLFMSGELKGGGGGGGDKSLSVAVESGSESDTNKENVNVWNTIADVSCHPWNGLDAVIHMGGQVDMDKAVAAATALLNRAEREEENSAVRQTLTDEALDHIREAYRTSWSLPGTRESLGNGSHIMLRGGMDFGSILVGRPVGGGVLVAESAAASSSPVTGFTKKVLRELVMQVYREYQRQLWDPIGERAERGGVDEDENKPTLNLPTQFLLTRLTRFALASLKMRLASLGAGVSDVTGVGSSGSEGNGEVSERALRKTRIRASERSEL